MDDDGRSLLDWLSDEDYRLRAALEPVNLVAELNLSADEVRTAQSKYGVAARAMLGRGHRYDDVIKKYPALTLAILVGHAALAYEQGAYWDEFWAELGLGRDNYFENAMRRQLVPLLDKFRLARFTKLERQNQYVMILAMHAGIPAHCLRDLLQMIDSHLVQGREATGVALLEWLDEPGKQYRTNALDVPVRNFLRYGGEFAVDILDRIIEVVDAAVVDPGLLDSGLDTATTGLPTVLVDELVHQLRNHPVEWKGRRATGGSVQRRPALAYSVDDDQLVVSVPYPRSSPELPWRVSFDGAVREVHAERSWGVADGNHAPTLVPVPTPVREILLWHDASDSSFSLQVVGTTDPMLTFGADGAWIPRRDGLKEAVWVIHPSDSELYDPECDRVVDAYMDSGVPAGWIGWRSVYVDLADVQALQLRRHGKPIGTTHAVRKDAVPTFHLSDPVSGCRTPEGRPVYAERPWVMLPPSATRATTKWRVRTRLFGQTEWICDDEWDAEEEQTCVDPFDDAEPGLLGLFEIVVTGPLGADVRTVVFVAEGLDADFDSELRIPAPGGLTPCTAALGSSTSLQVSSDLIEFAVDEPERLITLSSGADSADVVVRPQHITMRSGNRGEPATWRTTAETCAPGDLAQDRYVAVRLPQGMDAYFTFVDGAGETIHVEQARRKPGGVFETATARFADSARRAEIGKVVANVVGQVGSREVAVLAVRPPQVCSGVRLENGSLVFNGLIDSADLAVHVWCTTAPWLPARSLPLDSDTLELPADLVNAGELRCQVFVDDPWVLVEPPQRPDDTAFRVAQPGWVVSDDTARTKLSQFLAGEGPAPEAAGAMPEVWSALTMIGLDSSDTAASRTRSALIRMLSQEPRRALEGLGNSTIALRDKMGMLVGSELVNRSFATTFTLNELHADPWFGCMVEISDLPSLHRRRDEVREERAETLAYLRDKGGDLLIDTLATGKAAPLGEGCFDRNVFRLDAMPPSQVEELLVGLRLVPGALLDADTRVAGNVEAFHQRAAWMRAGWSDGFAAQTSFALTPIKRACPDAYEVISARNDALHGVPTAQHPWMLMSVQSLTLAVLARLEAHGRITGQYLNSGMLSAWAVMAQLCPRLVATDLLIAEALIVHFCRGDLTREY
ncbi:hypothetical protein [Mycolicibacterium celeriflavum]|uniref:hypothetical protein n=1 Tax=Mycolicibacterium celeriflavum TaxID=1249101 RepID=UPI003CF21F61